MAINYVTSLTYLATMVGPMDLDGHLWVSNYLDPFFSVAFFMSPRYDGNPIMSFKK